MKSDRIPNQTTKAMSYAAYPLRSLGPKAISHMFLHLLRRRFWKESWVVRRSIETRRESNPRQRSPLGYDRTAPGTARGVLDGKTRTPWQSRENNWTRNPNVYIERLSMLMCDVGSVN